MRISGGDKPVSLESGEILRIPIAGKRQAECMAYRRCFEEIYAADTRAILRELPDTDSFHAKRVRARLENHAKPLIKPHRAVGLRGGQLRQGLALGGQAQPGFFKGLLRPHPESCLALVQFLLCPLAFDSLRD